MYIHIVYRFFLICDKFICNAENLSLFLHRDVEDIIFVKKIIFICYIIFILHFMSRNYNFPVYLDILNIQNLNYIPIKVLLHVPSILLIYRKLRFQ